MPEFRILSIFNRYLQYGGEETMAAKIAETLSQKALHGAGRAIIS